MSHDALGDRLISYWRDSITETPHFLQSRRAAKSINGLLMNYRMWGEAHIGIGVVQWRRGGDPRAELTAGLNAIAHGIEEALTWPAGPQDIDQLKLWIAYPISYLMNRPLTALDGSSEQFNNYPLIAASFILADALFDRPYKDRVPSVLKNLAAQKRQMLALQSFTTYFDILEAKGEARIGELAAQADALYLRRTKDIYYDDPLLGGGSNNPIMLDWQLAAVLKKVEFSGNSPNRWHWG